MGEGVATAAEAGEEPGGAHVEAGAAGNEDGGELERAVGGDEAPEGKRHAVLGADGGDDADVDAVEDHEPEGGDDEEDAGKVGVEADADVVGHDAGGFLRFGAEDGVGPHFVVLDGVHHLRAEHGMDELRAHEGDDDAERGAGEEEQKGAGNPGKEAAEETGVAVEEEASDGARGEAAAGVDEVVGAGYEAVEVLLEGAGAAVGARGGKVGGGLAVEQAEEAEVGGRERLLRPEDSAWWASTSRRVQLSLRDAIQWLVIMRLTLAAILEAKAYAEGAE